MSARPSSCTRRISGHVLLALLLALAGACGGDSDAAGTGGSGSGKELVLYSGRDEDLLQPLIDDFEEASGISVDVRYGNSAEMGAQLLEEGPSTPAQVFYSQEVGALGALEEADLLAELPDDVVERVGGRFRPDEGKRWVGVTGRSRVIVVNPDMVDQPPDGVLELTGDEYAGKIAWAPGNASFQSFITAFRVTRGEAAARTWLQGMLDNEPIAYENNTEILEAVNNGDVAIGLINHYYWARAKAELGDRLSAKLIYPKGNDPGGLVNATAIGITAGAAADEEALALVRYLLSEEGQTHFVEETQEYPLVSGVEGPKGIPALASLEGPQVDLTDLESLEATQAMLTDLGLLG